MPAVLGALFLILASTPGSTEPVEWKATVIGVRDDRVYLVPSDSVAIEAGSTLRFLDRGKQIATGEVVRAYDAELSVARLTSGTLSGVKRLDRVRIVGEPPRLRPVPPFRVGYPSRLRPSLVFACPGMTVRSTLSASVYRVEAAAGDSSRLVRVPSSAPVLWPDTLSIRFFDDAADEEIALERGELDVAVFWPGELSPHMRDESRWPFFRGRRSRGLIAAVREHGPDSIEVAAMSRDLAALNQRVFRGDLEPWPGLDSTSDTMPVSSGVRVTVDPSLPGRRTIERFLDREERSQVPSARRPVVRLFYCDAPLQAPDSIAIAVSEYVAATTASASLRSKAAALAASVRDSHAPFDRERLHQGLRALGVTPLFTVRGSVVCRPSFRAYVNALGVDAFTDLAVCDPGVRRP